MSRLIIGMVTIVFAAALVSCGDSRLDAVEEIRLLESRFEEVNDGALLPSESTIVASRNLIAALESYVDKWPDDSNAADYLYKAANKKELLGQTREALESYDRIWRNYPDHELAPISHYRTGYIYEKVLRDFNTARQRYTEFADNHPDHPLAAGMDLQIQYLGDDNGLLKALQEKNQSGD